MSDEKTPETKVQDTSAGQDQKVVEPKATSDASSIDSFSSNLIMENQKKMVLQIEALEKKLAEAKRNEQNTLTLLRQREEADKERIQGELVSKALGEYPVLGNAKDVAINLIKSKLSFDDKQQPLWEGKQVDEAGLKGGLESFFKDNSFLLDKSVKTQSVVQNTVKQQPGQAVQSTYDMRTAEGINAFLRAKLSGGKK